MKNRTVVTLGWVVLLGLAMIGCEAGSAPQRYDYSSPEKSFRSLQKAFRDGDADGVMIHARETMRIWTQKETPEEMEDADRLFNEKWAGSDWLACDSAVVEYSTLKLSDVTDVTAGKPEKDAGVLASHLTLTWPGGETADDLFALSMDGGQTWWCGAAFIAGVHPTKAIQ